MPRGLRFQSTPVQCPSCKRSIRITLDKPHDPPRLAHHKHNGRRCPGSWKTMLEATKDAEVMRAIVAYRERQA
jgi:hypothetical protein